MIIANETTLIKFHMWVNNFRRGKVGDGQKSHKIVWINFLRKFWGGFIKSLSDNFLKNLVEF